MDGKEEETEEAAGRQEEVTLEEAAAVVVRLILSLYSTDAIIGNFKLGRVCSKRGINCAIFKPWRSGMAVWSYLPNSSPRRKKHLINIKATSVASKFNTFLCVRVSSCLTSTTLDFILFRFM